MHAAQARRRRPGARREPDAQSERLLVAYFGAKLCVVDGTPHTHWHHLDDDASNHRFEDFVPLGSTWNTKLRDARARALKSGSTYVPDELTADRLSHNSVVSQSSWQGARAYGQSRLAYYVGRLYTGKPTDQLLLYAANTLHYLRHRPSYRLVDDVVRRDVVPLTCRRDTISGYAAIRLLFEIACLYSENGHARRALAVHRIIERRLPRLGAGDGWYANARRRADTVVALVEDTPRQAVARLRRAARRAPSETGVHVSADVYRALHLFGDGEYARARDVLEPHYPLIVPPLEAFSDAARQMTAPMRPPLNVSPAAHFLQAYAVVHGATERGRRRRRTRDYEALLTDAFHVSGALLDQEVPFSWRTVLADGDARLCRPLPAGTLRSLDRAVRDLVAVLR